MIERNVDPSIIYNFCILTFFDWRSSFAGNRKKPRFTPTNASFPTLLQVNCWGLINFSPFCIPKVLSFSTVKILRIYLDNNYWHWIFYGTVKTHCHCHFQKHKEMQETLELCKRNIYPNVLAKAGKIFLSSHCMKTTTPNNQ